ncbi:MAG: hypothetical protein ABR545_00320 [Cyclonatronaceae bacterium]
MQFYTCKGFFFRKKVITRSRASFIQLSYSFQGGFSEPAGKREWLNGGDMTRAGMRQHCDRLYIEVIVY